MVWEKAAWLEESHAALGGTSYDGLTRHAVLMTLQATQRHFPRLHVLSEELWESALLLGCTVPQTSLGSLGEVHIALAMSSLENKGSWIVLQ